jgi:hypothetical protein
VERGAIVPHHRQRIEGPGHAIAAGVFRLVARPVGALDEIVGLTHLIRHRRNADAHGDRQRAPPPLDAPAADVCPQPFGDFDSVLRRAAR